MADGNSTQKAISEAQKGLDLIKEKTEIINKNLLEMKSILMSFSTMSKD
jgi:hypothetical protein